MWVQIPPSAPFSLAQNAMAKHLFAISRILPTSPWANASPPQMESLARNLNLLTESHNYVMLFVWGFAGVRRQTGEKQATVCSAVHRTVRHRDRRTDAGPAGRRRARSSRSLPAGANAGADPGRHGSRHRRPTIPTGCLRQPRLD